MRGLIIEDDPIIRDHIAFVLEKTNIFKEICLASNGQEALHCWKQEYFHIVFLDLKLPDVSGVELAKTLRLTNSEFALIFASGYREFGPEAFQLEAVDYLMKPLFRDQITSAIERALNYISYKNFEELKNQKLLIKQNSSTIIIDLSKVIFAERSGKKTVVHCGDEVIELNDYPLKNIYHLGKKVLLPAHKGFLINPLYVKELQPYSAKSYEVIFEKTSARALILKRKLKELRTICPNYKTFDTI